MVRHHLHPNTARPRRLTPGATIGIAAPAGPFEREPFDRGMAVLAEMGFNLRIPEDARRREGFLAGPDRVRTAVLDALFRDASVDGIVCARGGWGSTRLLHHLDWEAIRRHPKVFVGFSDITVLHWVLQARTGLVSFHGPVGTTLGSASDETRRFFTRVLMDDVPIDLAPAGAVVLAHGDAAGRVVGGNLSMLCHLVGTPYAPQFRDCLLLMEDVAEAPYRIDRMLVQMTLAGCFEGLAGVVLGQFEDCGEAADLLAVCMDTFGPMDIPVVAGFPFGHGRENWTLPLGIGARLTTRPPRLVYTETATR